MIPMLNKKVQCGVARGIVNMNRSNREKNPNTNPHIYSHFIFNKVAKVTQKE
jgi:hypothetical protein